MSCEVTRDDLAEALDEAADEVNRLHAELTKLRADRESLLAALEHLLDMVPYGAAYEQARKNAIYVVNQARAES